MSRVGNLPGWRQCFELPSVLLTLSVGGE